MPQNYTRGKHGISFAPATFKGGTRKTEAFEQMQLLALDFDNGITLSEVEDRAKDSNQNGEGYPLVYC